MAKKHTVRIYTSLHPRPLLLALKIILTFFVTVFLESLSMVRR